MRTKEKLMKVKKQLSVAEYLLKKMRKDLKRRQTQPKPKETKSIGIKVKPVKKWSIAIQFGDIVPVVPTFDVQPIAVQVGKISSVRSIAGQVDEDALEIHNNRILLEHNYAPKIPYERASKKVFKCHCCGYKATKESHVSGLETEYCQMNPNRNKKKFISPIIWSPSRLRQR